MRLKAWLMRMIREMPGLRKTTFSVAKGTLGVIGPCALILLLICMLDAMSAVYAWPAGGNALLALTGSLLVKPVTAGMITYAAGASWEGRRVKFADAVQLARIRIRDIAITGLAAGAVMLLAGGLANMIYSLIGIIPALLGWIPMIGQAVTGFAAFVVGMISLLMEFVAHIVLVVGMLSLTADGISGKAQIRRAADILFRGGERVLHELLLVFGTWIIGYGLYEMALWIPLPAAGIPVGAVLTTALTALSMTAVSVIYLKERDKKDGMRFHA